jgi:hypothetical protein
MRIWRRAVSRARIGRLARLVLLRARFPAWRIRQGADGVWTARRGRVVVAAATPGRLGRLISRACAAQYDPGGW